MKRFLLLITIYGVTRHSVQAKAQAMQAESKAYSSSQSFVNKYVNQPLFSKYNKDNDYKVYPEPNMSNLYWTTTTTTTVRPNIISITQKPVITYLVTSSRPVTIGEPLEPYPFVKRSNATIFDKLKVVKPTKTDDGEEAEYEDDEYSVDSEDNQNRDDGDQEEEETSEETQDEQMKNAAKNPLNFLNLLGTDFQPGRLVNIFFGLIVMLFMMIVQGYAMWVFGIAFLPGTRSFSSDWELDVDRLETLLGYVVEALEFWDAVNED